jgi:uncharacterized membrane protein
MNIMFALVTLVLIFAVVSTIQLTGKSDENYSSSTKRNTLNLTLIYVLVIFLALISLGIYIWLA